MKTTSRANILSRVISARRGSTMYAWAGLSIYQRMTRHNTFASNATHKIIPLFLQP